MLALRRLPSLARVAARPQIACLGTTGACKEKQLPWQLGRAPCLLNSKFEGQRRVPPTVPASRQGEMLKRARNPPRRPQSAGDADRVSSPKRHAQAPTPSAASRRRSRAARRSRRTSTSATRRPRPSTSARPSSRPSVWRTRRRPSRRSLARSWRRCCTRSTWPSARRRCASERRSPSAHPSVCVNTCPSDSRRLRGDGVAVTPSPRTQPGQGTSMHKER